MNGWQRLGIVLSVVWCVLVAGYAGYERSQLPVRFFGVEDNNPANGFSIARELLFVDVNSAPAGDTGAAMKLFEDAKTDEAKKAAAMKINAANSYVFETSLKDAFWLYLLIPLVALWALAYVAFFAFRFVRAGFKA
jgi:hypothetical protein